MKIHLAIVENDKNYLNRLISVFGTKYSDKLETYMFTELDIALKSLEENKIDVLLVDEKFELDKNMVTKRCAIAYLTDSMGVDSLHNEVAICKFQKVELIYKQILSVFSENASAITGMSFEQNDGIRIIAFLSPAGGTGCSTAAAAYSINLARKNKKVLYLNLEKFGSADKFFSAEGNGNFGDVIYAVKSRKANLAIKLESTVKQDITGVYFYSAANLALDMLEFTSQEIINLISDVKLFGGYDYVVLDMDFGVDTGTLEIMKECSSIILVSDAAELSNNKLERAIEALDILEQQSNMKIMLRMGVLLNRVSSHNSCVPDIGDLKLYGGIKRYEGYTIEKLIKELSNLSIFESIV